MPLGAEESHLFFLQPLLRAVKPSLTTLILGKLSLLPTPTPSYFEVLLPIAANLREIVILDCDVKPMQTTYLSTYLEEVLDSLREVKRLKIGLHGYDPSTIFQRLSKMKKLKSVVIRRGKWVRTSTLSRFNATECAAWLLGAEQLRFFGITHSLRKKYWSQEQFQQVEKAAEESSVRFWCKSL